MPHKRWFSTVADLANMSDDELSGGDIAAFNLLAAKDLPGAERLDTDASVRKLDAWADHVGQSTKHWWHKYVESPGEFDSSPGRFRILAMITVLQKHFGIRYNLSFSEGRYDATDSRNLFLHGVLSGHGGTCVTMPILYVAVGRRLGYPLRLVRAKGHLFARWQDPHGERFNIECTSLGFVSHDDDYYFTWPEPIADAEVQKGFFLQNLCSREEVALFLEERAHCLIDNLRIAEALQAYHLANRFVPDNPFVESGWAIATATAAILEKSQLRARSVDSWDIDLLTMDMPEPIQEWERRVFPFAWDNLRRIADIHKIKGGDMRAHTFGRINEPVST